MENQAAFIPHLHAFRGFAILNIVGAHAWSFMIFWTGPLDTAGLKWLFSVTETLFHGATLYFAIISGLLFSQILAKRGWRAFYTSKLVNVVCPFVVMTVLFTAMYWEYYVRSAQQSGTDANFLLSVAQNLLTGQSSIHLWYIPVLLVLFLVTPLLAFIQKRSQILMWALMLMPLVISRSPFPEFLKPQSFAYFIGAYALGMYLGAHYQQVLVFVRRHLNLLVFMAISSTVTLCLLYVWNYQPEGLYSSRQTLVYAQKVSVCLLVLYWFYKQEQYMPKSLMVLGSYAFAIYFLHVLVMGAGIQFARQWLQDSRPVELILSFGALNFVFTLIGSLLLAKVVKLLLGKHSRKVVGA